MTQTIILKRCIRYIHIASRLHQKALIKRRLQLFLEAIRADTTLIYPLPITPASQPAAIRDFFNTLKKLQPAHYGEHPLGKRLLPAKWARKLRDILLSDQPITLTNAYTDISSLD